MKIKRFNEEKSSIELYDFYEYKLRFSGKAASVYGTKTIIGRSIKHAFDINGLIIF